VLEHWKNDTAGTEADTHRVLNYLESVIASPEDATDLFLEYFADNSKGEELLKKYGSGITFADVESEAQQTVSNIEGSAAKF
jgi:hypothetical protein